MSTLTDIDYAILMTKITALESRVKKLEEHAPLSTNFKPYKSPEHSLKDCISTINIDDVVRSI